MSEPQPDAWQQVAAEEALTVRDPEGVSAWALDLRETLGRRALDWFDSLFGGGTFDGALADAFALLPWLVGLAALGVLMVALVQVGRLLARQRLPRREQAEEEALAETLVAMDLEKQARAHLSAGRYDEAVHLAWAWVRVGLDERGLGPLTVDMTHGEVVRRVRAAGVDTPRLGRLRLLARHMDVWRYGGGVPDQAVAEQALSQASEVLS